MAAAGAATHPGHQTLVESVASSQSLSRSPALRKLLLYLYQHRDEPISEYAIAIDVFGKREDFDPRIDATVRVHISRLRLKLKEYAESDGGRGGLRLVIPQGTHKLEFIEAPAAGAKPAWPGAAVTRWLIPAACMALLTLAAGLAWNNFSLRNELERSARINNLPAVWQSMLRPGRLTRVIYPIPVFYVWGQLRVRDVLINDPEGWRNSPNLAALVERLGKPQVSQSYSVASDTAAAIQLTRFLSSHGVPLEVSPTASLSLDNYGNENLLFLGIPPTNAALDKYVDRTNFYLLPGNGTVGNRKPLASEPEKFTGSTHPKNPTSQRRFGIIAVLPGHTPNSSLILLSGLQTAALATFLTSPLILEDFTSKWNQARRPDHWEAVVEAHLEAGALKDARLAAFRPIPANH